MFVSTGRPMLPSTCVEKPHLVDKEMSFVNVFSHEPAFLERYAILASATKDFGFRNLNMNLCLSIVILLILLVILFILLSSVFFHLVLDDKRKRGSLDWLFGSLYFDWSAKKTGFDLFNQRIWRGSLEKKEKPKKDKKKKKKLNYIALWEEKDVMAKTARIAFSSMGDLLRRSKFEKFLLDAKIATPDPALTGVLYGGISSISFPLQAFLRNASINVYPDFETDVPEAKGEISVKTRFFDLFKVAVRAFFLLPKIALIKMIRKLKKSRR